MAAVLNMLTKLRHAIFIYICLIPGTLQAEDIKLQPVSLNEWRTVLAEHKGKITVVDMWAMWCTSCIERFPKMVELSNKYDNNQVAIIGLNLDDRDDRLSISMAENFLNEVNANFANYHLDENLMLAFKELDLIGIPAVLIYDRQGNEIRRLTGDNPNRQFTDKDIEQVLKNLL